MRHFDEGIVFARDFIRAELGQLVGLKAWYCDSFDRYTMTDALQPLIATSSLSRRPPGDRKADRRRYLLWAHGSHLVDTVRFLAGDIVRLEADYLERGGAHSWFVSCAFAGGAHGQLDLTIPVHGDWHEGFQVYGEGGSVAGKSFLPWRLLSTEVEAFSARDRRFHRPLGADGHFWRRQVEGFAATVLEGAPQLGAGLEDGIAALRLLEAIERSAETGLPVEVPPPGDGEGTQ
jgi:predicted dehydrogenase